MKKSCVNNVLKILRDNNISICNHGNLQDNYHNHVVRGGNFEIKEILNEKDYNKWAHRYEVERYYSWINC